MLGSKARKPVPPGLFNIWRRCILILYVFFAETASKINFFGVAYISVVFKLFCYIFLFGNDDEYGQYGNKNVGSLR